MFDLFEDIYDVIVFSLFISFVWEVIYIIVFVTDWATAAPAWQVAILTFSWERIPLVFVVCLIIKGWVRSQLIQPSGEQYV